MENDVICAWCVPSRREDDPGLSHGICPSCSEKMLVQSARRQFGKVPSDVGDRKAFEGYKERNREKKS